MEYYFSQAWPLIYLASLSLDSLRKMDRHFSGVKG